MTATTARTTTGLLRLGTRASALARTQSQAHFLGHADSLRFYEAEYAAMRPMIDAMKLGK